MEMPRVIWIFVKFDKMNLSRFQEPDSTPYVPQSLLVAAEKKLEKARELIAETVRTFRPAFPNSSILDRSTAFLEENP